MKPTRWKSRDRVREIAHEAVACRTFVPHLTDLLDLEQHNAAIDASIATLAPEIRALLRTPDERAADQEEVTEIVRDMTEGSAPPDPRAFAQLLRRCETRRETLAWIDQEIAYALGLEVGLTLRARS